MHFPRPEIHGEIFFSFYLSEAKGGNSISINRKQEKVLRTTKHSFHKLQEKKASCCPLSACRHFKSTGEQEHCVSRDLCNHLLWPSEKQCVCFPDAFYRDQPWLQHSPEGTELSTQARYRTQATSSNVQAKWFYTYTNKTL